jgi:hypothetical protein
MLNGLGLSHQFEVTGRVGAPKLVWLNRPIFRDELPVVLHF